MLGLIHVLLNINLFPPKCHPSFLLFPSPHSFYRFVLEPEPLFSESGELAPGPHARFTGLPESPILTQNYHPPENWLVEVVESLHDLDNIKLELVESGVHR